MNPRPGTASDAQALFCALNTASVQLVPASVIALRAAAGSRAPAEIIGATLLASAVRRDGGDRRGEAPRPRLPGCRRAGRADPC